MEYRRLGKSGLKVSEIGLGGTAFGNWCSEQETTSIIHHALDLGINFIDTADKYSEGFSEEFVGKAVRDRRSKVIIATKFGMPMGEQPNDYGGSRYHITEAINASLKRLGTDYIDLYYIHQPDPTTPIEETLRTLDTLVKAGKVRYIGCSNFTAWQLCEALWTSKVNNLEPFVVVESQYNLLCRHIEAELIPCCQAYNIGVVPWGPLAHGLLTAGYQRGGPAPPGSPLATRRQGTPSHTGIGRTSAPPPRLINSIMTDADFDRLGKLKQFSEEHGHDVSELAIAWLLSHSWLSSVITGVINPERVSANVAATDWKLTAQELAQVESL